MAQQLGLSTITAMGMGSMLVRKLPPATWPKDKKVKFITNFQLKEKVINHSVTELCYSLIITEIILTLQ